MQKLLRIMLFAMCVRIKFSLAPKVYFRRLTHGFFVAVYVSEKKQVTAPGLEF